MKPHSGGRSWLSGNLDSDRFRANSYRRFILFCKRLSGAMSEGGEAFYIYVSLIWIVDVPLQCSCQPRSGEHQPGYYLHRRGLPPRQNPSAQHTASGFAPPWLIKSSWEQLHATMRRALQPHGSNKSPWELQKGALMTVFSYKLFIVRCSDALFVHLKLILILCVMFLSKWLFTFNPNTVTFGFS